MSAWNAYISHFIIGESWGELVLTIMPVCTQEFFSFHSVFGVTFNTCAWCNMAFTEPKHCSRPNITHFLLTLLFHKLIHTKYHCYCLYISILQLTHLGLVMPFGDLDLGSTLPWVIHVPCSVRETNARPLANTSAFWAGQVEHWPGQVKFCIEHITGICLWVSAPKI